MVAIALLLFAFSTAITWCYYGDRSTAYIFGERGVFWYRNFYVLCFILAAVIFCFIYMFVGKDFTPAVVSEVQKDSPAEISGMKNNDIILEIDNTIY